LAHQPRFGGSGDASGAVDETTGVGAGGTGVTVAIESLAATGAGSRMVDRRRGGASGGGSATAGAAS